MGLDFARIQTLESGGQVHRKLQLLLQVFLQARQLEGVAQTHQLGDLSIAIGVTEIGERALQLVDKVGINRLQGAKNRFQVGTILAHTLGCVPLDVLSLREGELQLLGQGAGEMVTTNIHRPLHDGFATICHHQR